jgi:hypothetical protein
MNEAKIARVPVVPSLRFLYTSRIALEAPLELGPAPHGRRRVIPIQGGAFEGPAMSGEVLPGGADWQIIRADGVAELEARYTLRTHDGALIYVNNWGLRHGPQEVMERLMAGKEVDPRQYYFRTLPKFETGSAKYDWLNRMIAVAAGQRRAGEVIITVYEVC